MQALQFVDAGLPGGQVLTHCRQERSRGWCGWSAQLVHVPPACHTVRASACISQPLRLCPPSPAWWLGPV